MNLKLNQIVANPDQPRKYFNIEKLAALKKSIKKYGIKNPLLVEEQKDGKFLIVDGERRYRAAQELELKEIPVIVDDTKDDLQRMIEQFHIQEQHEGWTPTEKASVVIEMARDLKIALPEIGELLNINIRTANRYMSFGKLINKERFQDKGIQIDWAEKINNLKDFTSKLYRMDLNKEFDQPKKSRLEKVIIDQISDDTMKSVGDITKLKDSFKKNPKSVEQYLEGKSSPDKLFVETKAKGAYHLRNGRNNALQLQNHLQGFMANADTKVGKDIVQLIKLVGRTCKEFVDRFDE